MKIISKVMRVVFWPFYCISDIRKCLMIQNDLFTRKVIFDIFASNIIDSEKSHLAKDFISCSKGQYLEDDSQKSPSMQEALYNAFHSKKYVVLLLLMTSRQLSISIFSACSFDAPPLRIYCKASYKQRYTTERANFSISFISYFYPPFFNPITTNTNVTNPRNMTSSLSYRVNTLRNPFNLRKRRSTSLRLLYNSLSYFQGCNLFCLGGTTE